MKTIYNICMIAIAAIAACACQKDRTADLPEEVTVSLRAGIDDDAARKSTGSASYIDKVHYEVWNEDYTRMAASGVGEVEDCTASIDLKLIRNKVYNIILWAQSSSCTAYSWDTLKEINISYKEEGKDYAAGNREERDAFYAVSRINTHNVVDKYVSLTRPFAQLNFFTTSLDYYEYKESEIRIKGLSDVFDTIAGEGKGASQEVCAFRAEGLFTSEQVAAEGAYYDYLAMNYILIPGTSAKIDIDASFTAAEGGNDVTGTHEMKNVAVGMNEKVNVYGQLIIK